MKHDKHLQHRGQEERKSMAEQLMQMQRETEEECDFSVIFSPPARVPETD